MRPEDKFYPPNKHNFNEWKQECYDQGYNDALSGKEYINPYKESGHERDSTFDDKRNYYYYSGYNEVGYEKYLKSNKEESLV